jgi:hypothetical protein
MAPENLFLGEIYLYKHTINTNSFNFMSDLKEMEGRPVSSCKSLRFELSVSLGGRIRRNSFVGKLSENIGDMVDRGSQQAHDGLIWRMLLGARMAT